MKTNKLIELLQKADPSGDSEVLIGNMDILPIIYGEAGYWDGRMKLAEYDEGANFPSRIRVSGRGSKVNLCPIDPQDRFVDSILYDQEEFDYDVEGGSKTYPYNWQHAEVMDRKMGWVHVAENYCSWFFNYDSNKPKEEKTRQLIADLKLKYSLEAKTSALASINSAVKEPAKTASIWLIEKIYENNPSVIMGSPSFGKEEIHFKLNSNYNHSFYVNIATGAISYHKSARDKETPNRDNYGNVPVDMPIDEAIKAIVEASENMYKRRAED